MHQPPATPKIYHIVHVDRLRSIAAAGELWCDQTIIANRIGGTTIGMSTIKERRMTLPVKCHQGDVVGQYVPFYFCPRSVMLFVIHRANHAELTYRGGQGPIVHLEADLHDVIAWADANNRRWAFTLSNAGAYYTEFRSDEDQLGEINWPAVASDDFRNSEVRERKQAEFLIKSAFPWHLVQAIGVKSTDIKNQADAAIAAAAHRPPVRIAPRWYF